MSLNFPLFIPSSIVTSASSMNLLTDAGVRRDEARAALYRVCCEQHFTGVVVVDGSGQFLLSDDEVASWRNRGIEIEQLSFQQDRELVSRFGKSHGEMQITEFMIQHSALVARAGGFYKLTARWTVENMRAIIPQICDLENVFFHFHPPVIRERRKFVCTAFYKMSLEGYRRHFDGCIGECGVGVSGYIESVFYRRAHRANLKRVRADFPLFSGTAGSFARPIENRYYAVRNLLSQAGFMASAF